MSMDRPYWGLRVRDLGRLPSIDARLQQITGLAGPLVHPVGGEWFAVTPSAETWMDEYWEDDEIIQTELWRIDGVAHAKRFTASAILPERVTLDPDDPETPTDRFHRWGDSSEPPDADGVSWYHRMCRFPQAWEITRWFDKPVPRGSKPIGHLDTGVTDHPSFRPLARSEGDPGFIQVHKGGNTLGDGAGPIDPLVGSGITHIGHGTRIGHVIYGDAPGLHVGGAPGCAVVPFRVAETVIILSPGGADPDDVAEGIRDAVDAGCSVINISMGGPGTSKLIGAVKYAYNRGVVICAAAGNVVWTPQNPAAFPATIALAAIGRTGRPWPDSARGPIVDVSAPGMGIWCGSSFLQNGRTLHSFGNDGSGTSYATALTTAACALWLTHHDTALDAYEGWRKVEAFRECLHASADTPADNAFLQETLGPGGAASVPWDPDQFGVGILNVEKLLQAPLPPTDTLQRKLG